MNLLHCEIVSSFSAVLLLMCSDCGAVAVANVVSGTKSIVAEGKPNGSCGVAGQLQHCALETNGLKRVATINRSWVLKKRDGKFPSARLTAASYSDYNGKYMIVFALHINVGLNAVDADGVIEGKVDNDRNIDGSVRINGKTGDLRVDLPEKATVNAGGVFDGLFIFKYLEEELQVKMLVDPRYDNEWASSHFDAHTNNVNKIKTSKGTKTARGIDIKSIEDLKEYFSH